MLRSLRIVRGLAVAATVLFAAFTAVAQDRAAVHGGPVRAVVVSADGRLLASAGFDHSVIFWDLESGRARAVARWHDGAVNALALLADGTIASAGEDGRIALWPPGTDGRMPARVLAGHEGTIAALAAEGEIIASAAWDGTVRLWQKDGTVVRRFDDHRGPVNAVVFRRDGLLVSGGADGVLRGWQPDGTALTLATFGLPINALAALPDGGIAAAGADGVVRLISAVGEMREVYTAARPIVALAVNRSGTLLAAATLGGNVAIIALPEGRLRHSLEGPGTPVWSLAFHPDDQTLWSGGTDRRVRRWNAVAGRAIGPVDAAAEEPLPAGVDSQGARVFQACAACHALRPDAPPMAGPHLHGLFGRRMGSVVGYPYSERLARGDIVWTPETVADLFTRGPDIVTPGTKMPIQRIENAEDMAALLRFLEQATR